MPPDITFYPAAMHPIERAWQSRGLIAWLMLPVAWFYDRLLACRHLAYAWGLKKQGSVTLPVVVVGNLSVGGTGKTPLCLYLVQHFQQAGWKPAIVSRGYGGPRREIPYRVTDKDTSSTVGDEPLMLYRQTDVPVCVCVDRTAAVQSIAENTDATIVFADDGLQHLAMPRAAEILVVDGARGFGNRWLLPAGPLRDSLKRTGTVSLVAIQVPAQLLNLSDGSANTALRPVAIAKLHDSLSHESMGRLIPPSLDNQFTLQPTHLIELATGRKRDLSHLRGKAVHAVAGIGHPQRFFESLEAVGISVHPHPLRDHHNYQSTDLDFDDALPVLVTSKDAVKLDQFAKERGIVFEVCVRVIATRSLQRAVSELEKNLLADRTATSAKTA